MVTVVQPFLHSQPTDENGHSVDHHAVRVVRLWTNDLGNYVMLRCSKLGSPGGLSDPEVKMRKGTPYLEDEVAQPGWHALFLQAGAE